VASAHRERDFQFVHRAILGGSVTIPPEYAKAKWPETIPSTGIDVSDTSLSWDRREKLSAYARAEVPTYWILNMVDRQLEVFTAPESDAYKNQQVFGPGDRAPIVIDGIEVGMIVVADLLP
jgi:Putative restriction endonuclease